MSHAAEDRSGIASSFILIGLFAVFSAAMKVGQDVAVAWRHGASLDGFWFVMSLLAWPVSLASAIFTIVVAPIQFRGFNGTEAEKAEAKVFASEVIGFVLTLGVVVTPLTWGLMHAILTSHWVGLSGDNLALAKRSVDALVWVIPLGLVAALCSANLTIHGSRMPTLIEALPAMTVIIAVVFFSGDSLLFGVFAGGALMCLAMVATASRSEILEAPRLSMEAASWKRVKSGILIVLLGQALIAAFPIVDQLFAVQLGDSNASHVSYASRLLVGFQALIGVIFQRASMNAMARQQICAIESSSEVGADRHWSVIAFMTGLAMAVFVLLLAEPVVGVLLSRGRFTQEDEAAVVTLVRAGALQMPFYLAGIVLASGAALRGDHSIFFWSPLMGLIMKALTAIILLNHFGPSSIPISTAALYATTAIMLYASSVNGVAKPTSLK